MDLIKIKFHQIKIHFNRFETNSVDKETLGLIGMSQNKSKSHIIYENKNMFYCHNLSIWIWLKSNTDY